MDETLSAPKTVNEDGKNLISLCIAEYQALSAKSTALVNLMFTLWTVAFAYLGFRVHIWPGANHQLVLWSTLLIEQVITLAWLFLLIEQYGLVLYIETDLRDLVKMNVHTESFWKYESYLNKRRKTIWAPWEWIGGFSCAVALISIFIARLRNQWSCREVFPLILSFILLSLIIVVSVKVINTRKQWRREE